MALALASTIVLASLLLVVDAPPAAASEVTKLTLTVPLVWEGRSNESRTGVVASSVLGGGVNDTLALELDLNQTVWDNGTWTLSFYRDMVPNGTTWMSWTQYTSGWREPPIAPYQTRLLRASFDFRIPDGAGAPFLPPIPVTPPAAPSPPVSQPEPPAPPVEPPVESPVEAPGAPDLSGSAPAKWTVTSVTLRSPYYVDRPHFGGNVIPINDDVHVHINGERVAVRGTSHGAMRTFSYALEVEGWIADGRLGEAAAAAVRDGRNVLDLVLEEKNGRGGLGLLELVIEIELGER